MANLIALLSSGKGTWGQVNSLLKVEKWDHIYLLCNNYAYENFECDPQTVTKLILDENKIVESMNKLGKFFRTQIKDIDIALNLSSGTGMEHMAVVSAVLKAGLGIKFVYADYDELKEFNILDLPYNEDDEDEF